MPCSVIKSSKCRCENKSNKSSMDCVTDHSLVRKLFSDHTWYIQDYVQAVIFKLPTAAALRVRVLDNQTEIGLELGKFDKVGSKNGKAVGNLLTEHVALAEAAVVAAIGGNQTDLKQATTKLFEQGDRMSDTLAKVLDLKPKTVRAEFHSHNQHVLNLATLLLSKKYGTEYVAQLDAYLNHMLMLADIIYTAVSVVEESSDASSEDS